MEGLLQDVVYGLRVLRKNPVFTVVAVLTLALGIGANTAMFSVFNGVLLSPLPYPHPEQLIALGASKANFQNGSISYPNFRDWQKDNHTFESLAVFRPTSYALTGLGEAEEVNAELVSSGLFPMLNIRPVLGRLFAPREDEIGTAPTALITQSLWQRKFGSSRDVLGKSVALDGRDYTIVGVVPGGGMPGVMSMQAADIYVPIGQWTNNLLTDRGAGLGIRGLGRLKSDVTLEQARADMARVTANLAAAYPEKNRGTGAHLVPLKNAVIGSVRPLLLILLGAVGVVLLIACGNVANLLLARATSRQHEFGVRVALGAGRARLVRQLLTESMVLALMGGALGLALAYRGTQAGLKFFTAGLPRASNIGVDTRVLLFTAGASLLAGILFGLAPAFRAALADAGSTLTDRSRGTNAAKSRMQGVFVVMELAMALVLMVSAGLMIRTLAALWSVNPGLRAENLVSFGVTLPPSMMNASPEAVRAALRNLDSELNTSPGVEAGAISWGAFPMAGDDEVTFWIDGQSKPTSQNQMNWALNYVVGPQYLRAMGTELVRGRFFTEQDNEHAAHVVAVDESFARKFFPHEDVIGKRLHLNTGDDETVEVVGVVRHVLQWGLDADSSMPLQAELYRPFMQLPDDAMKLTATGVTYAVRFDPTTHTGFNELRQGLQQKYPEQAIYAVQTMEEIITATLERRKLVMVLLTGFAVFALALASIGIYGVISYVVAQRTQEIGIRMAMGARPADVLKMIARQGLRLIAIGLICGSVAALAVTRALSTMLFGVKPFDAMTFLATALLLLVIAMLAIGVPAARATRVDPIIALREQ